MNDIFKILDNPTKYGFNEKINLFSDCNSIVIYCDDYFKTFYFTNYHYMNEGYFIEGIEINLFLKNKEKTQNPHAEQIRL